MKIAISVPTGYHKRELFMPLKPFFEQDSEVTAVLTISPAAPWRRQIFPEYGPKFEFMPNPADQTGHRKLLKEWRPDVVVTSTAGHEPRDWPILQAAEELRIPSVTFIASWDNVFKMERMIRFGKPQLVRGQLVVWNEIMRTHLLRIFPQLRREQVAVIGAPRFDYFTHREKIPTETALRQYLGIPTDEGKLIHLSSTELYPMDYIIRAVFPLKNKNHFLVSVHPGGKLSRHQAMENYGAKVFYSFGRQENARVPDFQYNPSLTDVYMHVALFKYSAMLINQSSTTVMESLMADIPIISVAFGKRFDWWCWYRSMVYRDFYQHYADIIAGRAVVLAKHRRELRQAFEKFLQHPEELRAERVSLIKKMITTTNGTASQQMLNLIKQCAAS